ncbi:PREDICTED: protein yellow [Ceratosolen solmsi marchali]|uniref:Protein yellow n=1 Tax=Ceratosolen solmsi marchali TaxID=326594 RepID=A0AAJ6YBF8_9HYME|nr:PREDICTED: protein yellow [Ceratosolen solmsi marchali]
MFRYLLLTLLIVIDMTTTAYELPKFFGKNIHWTGGSNIDWPCATTKNMYKSNGKYISKNVIATRAAIYKDEAFLTLPRYRPGVPATLAKISLKGNHYQWSISPFPSWTFQEEGNCAALQSVVDLFLDPQGILWVLDTGIVNSLENPIRKCPPKVLAINARTGKVVKTVDVSPLSNDSSRLQYIVTDYSHDGRVFIYVSDAANRAILVFDVTSGRGYRVILPKPVSLGCTRRDVLYMALIRGADGSNYLLFTYLSSTNLFSIKTLYLQTGSAYGKINDLGPKHDKIVFLGTDNRSVLYFRKEGESDIYRWDLLVYPSNESIQRVYKGNSCAFPTHVMPDFKRGRMRVLESNFPDFFQGTVGCGIDHTLKVF